MRLRQQQRERLEEKEREYLRKYKIFDAAIRICEQCLKGLEYEKEREREEEERCGKFELAHRICL